jgi:predicted RNA-binding Zn ribbon-like protein
LEVKDGTILSEARVTADNPLAEMNRVGGRLCLDFTNTIDAYDPPLADKLRTYDDLVWWGLLVGAVDEAQAEALFARAEAEPDAAAEVHARAVELRGAMYRAFSAASEGGKANADDLAVVNGELSRALPHLRLCTGAECCAWEWEEGAELDRVLWPVVRDAADLLASGELVRVGECQGERCDWLYLDTSRNRSRRWCDMASCGNRAKAKRHYHRAKSGTGDD